MIVEFCNGQLFGDLQADAVPQQFLHRLGDAVALDIGFGGEGHGMHAAQLDHLEVRRGRTGQLHRGVRFHAQHIGRLHGAAHVDHQLGKAALEIHQPRTDPESSQPFGDGEPHFAGDGGINAVARPHQAEGRGFHALGGGEDFGAFRRHAYAVDMARHQRRAELTFEFLHMAAQRINRLAELLGCGAERALARHLQKHPHGIPVGQNACGAEPRWASASCSVSGTPMSRTGCIRQAPSLHLKLHQNSVGN